jgi:aspartyl protease family protein
MADGPQRTIALPDHPQGPWNTLPPAPPEAKPRWRPTRGMIVWLALVAGSIAAFLALIVLFPGQLSGMDAADAVYMLGFLALVSGGLVFARGVRLREVARNATIWIGVAAVAVLGYSFRDEISGAFAKVRGQVIPAYAVSNAPHEMTVTRSDDGGFYILGGVGGAPVRFAIDTGANGVVLSPADAKRAGIDASGLKFASPSETANGVGYFAPVTLPTMEVGQLKLANVPAAVNQAPMSASLLGMAFLRRMDSVEIHGDQLTLKWKSPTNGAPVQAGPAT